MKRVLMVIVVTAGLVLTTGAGNMGPLDNSSLLSREALAQKGNPPDTGAKFQQAVAAPSYAAVSEIVAKYHCAVCHGGSEPRAGLSLDDHKSLMKGSKRGPVVVPGNPSNSEIILRLQGISEPRMPFTGPPWLSDEEVATIEQWITAGAKE
jgi:uncharacterized membrane protein